MAHALRHVITCVVLFIGPLILVLAQNDPCTVCPNGDPITLPEKALSLPGFEVIDSCGTLDSTIGVFFQSDADECALIQSAGSICGCPISEGACYLCGENSFVQQPDREVPHLLDIEGIQPTCEFIEAYLHSINETDSLCESTKTFTASYCGCPNSPPLEGPMCTLCPRGEAVPDANRTLPIDGSPFGTCGEAEQAAALYLPQGSGTCKHFQSVSPLFCGCETSNSVKSPCSMCPDGSPAALPDVDLGGLLGGVASRNGVDLGGIVPTCRVVEAAALSYELVSQECQAVRSIAGVCGCPAIVNACDFCPGEDVVLPDKVVQISVTVIGAFATCSQIDALATQIENGFGVCDLAQGINYICGCNGGEREYLGAETETKKAALVWVPRFSALLSMFGSSMIMYDILRDKTKRGSVFHTLMVAMALFDFIGSIAWALSTLPIPEFEYGEPSGIYGAKGNEATCTAQGFFVQLGYTSIFYNMSLSFYFLCVVRYRMQEIQLKKRQIWFHIPALFIGFTLAFGGIPFYGNQFWGCYLSPPPLVEDLRYVVIFAALPICTAVAILTVNTILVYWAVRKQMIAAGKWRITRAVLKPTETSLARNSTVSVALPMDLDASGVSVHPRRRKSKRDSQIQKLERQTFWQALFYLGAFYLTWPILLASNLNDNAGSYYGFVILVFTLAPLQGFLNFLVYARPRIQRVLRMRKRARRRIQMEKTQTASIPERKVKEDKEDISEPVEDHYLPVGPELGRSSVRFEVADMPSIPEVKDKQDKDEISEPVEDHYLPGGPELGRSSARFEVAAMSDSP